MCFNSEKSEVTKRNWIKFKCSRCTYEWWAVAPADMKRQSSERKKLSKTRSWRKLQKPTLPPKYEEKKDEEGDEGRTSTSYNRFYKRVHPKVLDRGEDDSYEGSSSDASILVFNKDPHRPRKSEKGTARKTGINKTKQLENVRKYSKSARKHTSFKDRRNISISKTVDIAAHSSPLKHLPSSSPQSQISQSISYERKEQIYADCFVKSIICDGNMLVLIGACTNCRTANEVDVAIMDARNSMDVECYKCGTSYKIKSPPENLLKAIGKE